MRDLKVIKSIELLVVLFTISGSGRVCVCGGVWVGRRGYYLPV